MHKTSVPGIKTTIKLILLLFPAAFAWAGSITVTDTSDNTDNSTCSLRDAIEAANGDTIENGCEGATAGNNSIILKGETYRLNQGPLSIKSNITIISIAGPNGNLTVIDGNNSSRIFDVGPIGTNPTSTIANVTIQNGRASNGGGAGVQIGRASCRERV